MFIARNIKLDLNKSMGKRKKMEVGVLIPETPIGPVNIKLSYEEVETSELPEKRAELACGSERQKERIHKRMDFSFSYEKPITKTNLEVLENEAKNKAREKIEEALEQHVDQIAALTDCPENCPREERIAKGKCRFGDIIYTTSGWLFWKKDIVKFSASAEAWYLIRCGNISEQDYNELRQEMEIFDYGLDKERERIINKNTQ